MKNIRKDGSDMAAKKEEGFLGLMDHMQKKKYPKMFPHLEDIEDKLDVDLRCKPASLDVGG